MSEKLETTAAHEPSSPPQYDAMYTPTQQQPQIVVVQSQPTIAFGPKPMRVTCPSCHQTNVSKINYENSMKTHIIATILCVTTCCCCIPYMVDSCKNANHLCQHCGAYLGTYGN